MKNLDRSFTTAVIWVSTAFMRSVSNEYFIIILGCATILSIFIWLGSYQKGE